jgi:DNA (cytosine-5)-methyltransferase 1
MESIDKIDLPVFPQIHPTIIDMTELSKKTREELIAICKENSIKGYSGKKKEDIVNLLKTSFSKKNTVVVSHACTTEATPPSIDLSAIKSDSPHPKELRMIDLFAGTGAFSLAFQQTNHVDIVFANDMVEHSKKIYDANFQHKLTLKNINDIRPEDVPAHDILTGGFPCQPFSIAGLQEGFNDERTNVFWKILEIIDHHHPKCVILENVKNLVTHDDGKTFNTIKDGLEKKGYHLCYKVLDTAKITGIPQHRERIYIVCIKSKEVFDKFTLEFPEVEKGPINDLLETGAVPAKYHYSDRMKIWDVLKTGVVKKNTVYQYRRVYVRENKSNECPTLTANMGGGGHNVPIILDNINNSIRKLTPRECFNLQGFPTSYILPCSLSDSSLYKLSGNAVSVPVVKLIADRITPLLLPQEE